MRPAQETPDSLPDFRKQALQRSQAVGASLELQGDPKAPQGEMELWNLGPGEVDVPRGRKREQTELLRKVRRGPGQSQRAQREDPPDQVLLEQRCSEAHWQAQIYDSIQVL